VENIKIAVSVENKQQSSSQLLTQSLCLEKKLQEEDLWSVKKKFAERERRQRKRKIKNPATQIGTSARCSEEWGAGGSEEPLFTRSGEGGTRLVWRLKRRKAARERGA